MYKAGDKVKVISKEKFDELCGVRDHIRAAKLDNTCHMTKQMARLCGKVVTIALVDEDGTYVIKEGRVPRQWWSDSMFEGLATEKEVVDSLEGAKPKGLYKAGDKVEIISREKYDELRGNDSCIPGRNLDGAYSFTGAMASLCGETLTIRVADPVDGTYYLEEDTFENGWSDSMFAGLSDKEPISAAEVERRMDKAKEDLRKEMTGKLKDCLDSIFDKTIDKVVDQVKEDIKSAKKENKSEASVNECPKFDTVATNINKIKQAIQELGDSLVSIDKDEIVVKGDDYDIKVWFNK